MKRPLAVSSLVLSIALLLPAVARPAFCCDDPPCPTPSPKPLWPSAVLELRNLELFSIDTANLLDGPPAKNGVLPGTGEFISLTSRRALFRMPLAFTLTL
jgi:hypothetical protein